MRQITDPIYDAEIDHLGNIWLETVSKGIYKCRLNKDMDAFRYYTYYGHEKDCTLPIHLQIFKTSGRVIFLGSGNHFYSYDVNSDTLQPNQLLNQCFQNINNIKRIVSINSEESWAITGSSIYRFFYDGYIARINESYKVETDNLSLITAFENISILNDSLSLVCLDAGFFFTAPNTANARTYNSLLPIWNSYKQALGKCIIDGEAYGDSVVFVGYPEVLGQVGISTCLVLACMYEYLLEKVDSTWSRPEQRNSISYARLPEGNYTLHIRATDELNNYSPDTIINFGILFLDFIL